MKYIMISTLFYNVDSFNLFKFHPKVKFKYEGATKPLDYWDPLQISYNCDTNMIKYLREAELQHSRLAMTSSLILPCLDLVKPSELSINYISNLELSTQYSLLALFSLYEINRILVNYKPLSEGLFKMKEDVEPGNYLDFDLTCEKNYMNKELNNGRLAMIGVIGYIVQEFITQTSIF